jgi:hypothetical protein
LYINDQLGLSKPSLQARILSTKQGELVLRRVTRGGLGAGLPGGKGLGSTLPAQLAPL